MNGPRKNYKGLESGMNYIEGMEKGLFSAIQCDHKREKDKNYAKLFQFWKVHSMPCKNDFITYF